MEVCVCKHCGKLFNSRGKSTSCIECVHKDYAKFQEVEKYLLIHPRSNALQLSAALSVKVQDILQFINEGRLVIIDDKIGLAQRPK